MKEEISIPLITSNRINMPETAEKILSDGDADMISMARPFSRPRMGKQSSGRKSRWNKYMYWLQSGVFRSCFEQKVASCLVNPRACHETELVYEQTINKKK